MGREIFMDKTFSYAASDTKSINLGLWIDDPAKMVCTKKYVNKLKQLHIDHVAVMIDDSPRRWKPTWKVSDLARLNKLLGDANIGLVLTGWPYPDAQVIDNMREWFIENIPKIGPIEGIECDLEFNWKSGKRPKNGQIPNMDKAGDYLLAALEEVRALTGVETVLEMTTFGQHTENGATADVAPHVDRLMVQSYSVASRKRKDKRGRTYTWKVPWDHTYGPGNMQKFTLDRTMLVSGIDDGHPEVGVGLAAWNQKWKGYKRDEAMDLALFTALEMGVTWIRYWSSKWVIGVMTKKSPNACQEIFDYIRSIKGPI